MEFPRKAILLICGLLIVAILSFLLFNRPQRTVFVSGKTVFEGFLMTREIQKQAQLEAKARQRHLDSLFVLLKTADNMPVKEQLQIAIAEEKQYLDNFESAFSSVQTPKVWARIVDYAKLYAQEKGYDYILGAQPDANIIYGTPDADVTEDFLTFINTKYEGN